jgi:hypothetical protein
MVELLDRMFGDTLWIYTGIVGSIFGALFIAYMRDTRIGLWFYGKWDFVLDFVRDRYGWTWFNQNADAWRKVNPNIAKKIDEIETRVKELEK